MKKLLILSLGLLLSAVLFAAGTPQGTSAGGITEVTYIFWNRGTVPTAQGTIDDNWWTRYVDEQLAPMGIKLRYIQIPQAQESQTMSTMLAANNAPDVSKTSSIPLLNTYISGGGVTDITSLVDRFGRNIQSLLGEPVLADIKSEGKIYFLPHLQNGITGTATWIRTDWLNAMGLATPSNPDEFHQALRAVKDRDPGRVGAPLVPFGMMGQTFSGWEGIIMPAFITAPLTTDRFLVPYVMWPEAKEALRYMNMLYSEGLITDEFVVDRDQSIFRQRISRGEMFAFLAAGHYPYHSAYGHLYDRLREHTPNATLNSISTFGKDENGDALTFWGRIPIYQYRWFVPHSSRNAELAVKVFDWMSTPAGYMVGGLGLEGEDYRMVNGVPEPINQQSYLERVPWIEPQYGLAAKPYSRPEDKNLFLLSYIKDFNSAYHQQIMREAVFLTDVKYYPPTISAPTPISDRLTPVVNEFWSNVLIRIITAAPANFDRAYDDAIREYRALGGDEIVNEARRLYR